MDPRFQPGDLWRKDGHLSDLVLTALADGQDALYPKEALEHAETCTDCARRLGQTALLSLRVSEALADARVVRGIEAEPRLGVGLPLYALVAALALALLGSVPRLLEFLYSLEEAPRSLMETTLVAIKGVMLLFRGATQQDTAAVVLAWCASALALLALGGLVARLAPTTPLTRRTHVPPEL